MLENLTPREREIFDLFLEGLSAKEITYKLNISIPTVDFHRKNLYSKLGINTIQELLIKYSAYVKAASSEMEAAPAGRVIPITNLGFFSTSDADVGGNSTSEVFVSREEINGNVTDVLNLKTNLVRRENGIELYASAYTSKYGFIQRLRQANGVRFKARGDGKEWLVEFQTLESTPERNYAPYAYIVDTVRDQVIAVDIPYSSLYIPELWKQYPFDFNKERIRNLVISAGVFLQGYGSSFLQIFDFEIY